MCQGCGLRESVPEERAGMMAGGYESCPEDLGAMGIHGNASAGLVVIGVGGGQVGW